MPVFTTGSTALSFTQQFLRQDPTKYVVGGRLYFYLPGTTTPLSGYKDAAAVLQWPNPYILDQDGRIPNIFFITTIDTIPVGYTSVRMRLIDKDGVLQFDFDNIPLLSPGGTGGGSGGVDTTDPNSVLTTGDLKARYGAGKIPGFVRANGLTIGPFGSGATEHDNNETQALFMYLWNADPNLVVIGGRGPNANDDWLNGTKQVTLPDWSGRALAFLDNMSGTPRGVLTAATFTGLNPLTLGAAAGTEQHTILENQMPVHDHPAFINDPGHSHPPPGADAGAQFLTASLGAGANIGGGVAIKSFGVQAAFTNIKVKSTSALAVPDEKTGAKGGGLPHLNMQPTRLATLYIRL